MNPLQPSSPTGRSDLDRPEPAAARLVAISIASSNRRIQDRWRAARTMRQPILDFPCLISAVKDRGFLDLSGTGSGRRILGSVPQFFSRSVQSINRLIGPTARIVPAWEDLLARFGYGRVAIFL
jgi:hypothetical protein